MGTPNPGQYQPYQQPYPQGQPPPQQAPQYAPPAGYPQQGGYQQGGYGAPAGYAPAPADPPGTYMGHPLADWINRVGASVVDGLIMGAPGTVGYLLGFLVLATTDPFTGLRTPSAAGLLLIFVTGLVSFGLWIYNYVIMQGNTGQTWGKRILSIRLVRMSDGQPVGPGMSFVRYIAHLADSFSLGIGYLFPLWDAHRQTFADKICSTLVLADPNRR
jgi:uncharacterized RDD family membrane protein YckC